MISLSNLLKYSNVLQADKRLLQPKTIQRDNLVKREPEEVVSELELKIQQLKEQKEQLLTDLEELESRSSSIQEQLLQQQEAFGREQAAQKQAMLEELESLKQETLAAAQQQGFDKGYEAGYRQLKEEMQEQVKQVNHVVQLAYQEKDSIIQSAEPFLLALSTQIAGKVLMQALEEDQTRFLPMVQSVLQQISEMKEIKIEVDPGYYELLLNHQDELAHWLDKDCKLQIVPKQLEGVGNCIVHTPKGSYDLTISQQLEEIKEQLLAFYKENDAE